MNVLPAIVDEIIKCQPYLRWNHSPDGSVELRLSGAKGSVRQENDRLYITRYANAESSISPMWSPVAVATISLFDLEFLNKTLRITKEMFNILPAIREQIDKSHPTVYWRQISENCIETTSEPQVTIVYSPSDNTITLSSCYVEDAMCASYNSYDFSTIIDLLDPDFLEAILHAFAYHRVP